MKYYLLIIVIIFLYSSEQIIAQNTSNDYHNLYGLDSQLINGEVYNNVINSNIKGHQFLFDKEFKNGTITINEKRYYCEHLNYDINNQKIVLQYTTSFGSTKAIAISKAWLKEFTIQDKLFIIDSLNSNITIFQAINDDSIRLLYFWSKSIYLKTKSGGSNYYFTDPKKDTYIRINGCIKQFSNNKKFITLFDENKQIEIKQYLKKNKINVKKSPDLKMLALINFCNKILPK